MCVPTTDDSLGKSLASDIEMTYAALTSSDAKTSHEVVDNGEYGGSPMERNPKGLDTAVQRNADNEGDVEPIDMLVPIRLGDGGIGNMGLLGIVGLAAVGL